MGVLLTMGEDWEETEEERELDNVEESTDSFEKAAVDVMMAATPEVVGEIEELLQRALEAKQNRSLSILSGDSFPH